MENLIYILASVVPTILFLLIVFYLVVIKKVSEPRIVVTKKPLQLVGLSIKSTDENINRDDALLWKEFKKIRVKNNLPKPFTTIIVRLYKEKGEELYEYFIGILGESDNVPAGFKYLEIPPQQYVMSRHRFKKGTSWLNSATKVKFNIYDKWLPDSEYELNRDQPIKAVEVHRTREDSKKRKTEIFVAVKNVDQARYH